MAATNTTNRPRSGPGRRLLLAKLAFVLAGTLSFLLSVSLWFLAEEPEQAIFVGIWVPSLFSLGALVLAGGGRHE